jgi:hypothetical protein
MAAHAVGKDRRRLKHQRRIKRDAMDTAEFALLKAKVAIKDARTFDDLFGIVSAVVEGVLGLGELYVYDTSLRIGAKLGVYPDRVYLHAGTRKGAKALGLNFRADSIPMDEVPLPLRKLPAVDVEDILCIFKDDFGKKGNHLAKKISSCCDPKVVAC